MQYQLQIIIFTKYFHVLKILPCLHNKRTLRWSSKIRYSSYSSFRQEELILAFSKEWQEKLENSLLADPVLCEHMHLCGYCFMCKALGWRSPCSQHFCIWICIWMYPHTISVHTLWVLDTGFLFLTKLTSFFLVPVKAECFLNTDPLCWFGTTSLNIHKYICFFYLQISVEELEHSISVKIAKEAVMSINSPRNLFKPSNGFLETKVYIAGLPRKVDNTLIKPVIVFSANVTHQVLHYLLYCNQS